MEGNKDRRGLRLVGNEENASVFYELRDSILRGDVIKKARIDEELEEKRIDEKQYKELLEILFDSLELRSLVSDKLKLENENLTLKLQISERENAELRLRLKNAESETVRFQSENTELKLKLEQSVEKIKELEDALKNAGIDGLTGLFRSELIEPKIESLVRELTMTENLRPSRKGFMLIFIDIDNFGEVNRLYGHVIGNKVLAEFGAQIKGIMRDDDLAYRFGGEECVLILPFDSDKEGDILPEAQKGVFERIQEEINSLIVSIEITDENNSELKQVKRLPITAATGYAFFKQGEQAKTPKEIITIANNMERKNKDMVVKKARIEKAMQALLKTS